MIVSKFKNVIFWLGAIIFLPLFNLLARRKNNNKELRILIIPHLTRVGDLICVTPAIRVIKQKYPHSFIAVAVGKKIELILENNPYVDAVVVFRSNQVFHFLHKIYRRNFNWIFNFSGTSFGTLISIYGAIPNKVKLTKEERSWDEVFTDWFNNFNFLFKNHTDPILHYLKMLEVLNIKSYDTKKDIFISESGELKAKKFSGFLVGISISAGNKVKEWGDEKFKELAVKINEKYGAKIIFMGAPNDESRILRIIEDLDKDKFLMATDFSMGELPSLIKRLRLYIATDTGPIHIADALRVPFIDIVGPVDPAELPPKREYGILVSPPHIKPSVFAFKKNGPPEEQKKALDAILVEDVLKAVETITLR